MIRLSIILAIFCIALLFFLLFWMPYKPISSDKELRQSVDNEKLTVSGKIISMSIKDKKILLKLDNNITAIYKKTSPYLKDEDVRLYGHKESYFGDSIIVHRVVFNHKR
ncbi:hypothetical protein FJZ18_01845 [Candidatus Pacearchaeota archaeon]|nr:hypothetical protein [Candidatus Pacearchaeota archaeon]